MIKLLVPIFFLCDFSFALQKQKFVTSYLLPNTTNTALPFSLDSEDPHDSTITLRISCSKQARKLDITSTDSKLCELKEITGTHNEIKKILENVKVNISKLKKPKKKLSITYDLIFFNKLSKKPKLKSVQQKLLPLTSIPVKIKGQRIERERIDDDFFKIPVADVSRKYLRNANTTDLEPEYNPSLPKDSISHKFVNNTLYIQGSFSGNFSSDPSFTHFDLTIVDRRTGLRSEPIKLHVLDGSEQLYHPSFVFLAYLCICSVLIFFTRQILFLISRKFLVIDEVQEKKIEEKLERRRIKRVKSSPNLGVVWNEEEDCEKGQLGEEFERLKEEFKRLPEICKEKWKKILEKKKKGKERKKV